MLRQHTFAALPPTARRPLEPRWPTYTWEVLSAMYLGAGTTNQMMVRLSVPFETAGVYVNTFAATLDDTPACPMRPKPVPVPMVLSVRAPACEVAF